MRGYRLRVGKLRGRWYAAGYYFWRWTDSFIDAVSAASARLKELHENERRGYHDFER
jgi:hypothetical protein